MLYTGVVTVKRQQLNKHIGGSKVGNDWRQQLTHASLLNLAPFDHVEENSLL